MSEQVPDSEHAWYYNTTTHQVEHGMWSAFTDRIGPYPTQAAAEHALATAKSRNDAWRAQDREWHKGEREDDEYEEDN